MKNTTNRDWSIYRTTGDDLFSTPSSGGARRSASLSGNSAVAYGESVIVLLKNDSYSSLCCGLIGRDESRICLKDRASCSVESHHKNRCEPEAGIYIRSKDPEKVFCAPVGNIKFFVPYKTDILDSQEKAPNSWAKKFNVWYLAEKDNSDPKVIMQKQAMAKRMQTPSKRSSNLKFEEPKVFPIDPQGSSSKFLEIYEEFWRRDLPASDVATDPEAADVKPSAIALPQNFILRDLVLDSVSAIQSLHKSLMDLSVIHNTGAALVDNAVEATSLRVSDLEVMVGVTPDDKGLAPNLWTSVAQAFQDIQTLTTDLMAAKSRTEGINAKVEDHEDELNKLFAISSGALSDIKRNVLTVSQRVDALELDEHLQTPRNRDEDTENCLGELLERVEEIEDLRLKDREALEEIQASHDGTSDAFPYGNGQHFRSATDIRTYLKDNNLLKIDFGGFLCPYSVLVRVKEHMDGLGSLGDVVKRKKDIKGLHLSEPEARVIYSHTSMMPCLFTGDATDKSEIGSLPKYSKWRNKSTQTGLAYSLEKFLPAVQRKVTLLINQRYGTSRVLGIVAKDMLIKSIDFISQLIRWVDDTYSLLTAGGNTAEDCWWIVTRVIRSIFEGHLGPARNTPEADKEDVSEEYPSMMIWGSMQCVLAAEAMVAQGIQDHPIVNGAFSTWLVHNTGRQEALDAVKLCESLRTKVKEQDATIADLKSQLTSLKKTVDNKLSKAKNG